MEDKRPHTNDSDRIILGLYVIFAVYHILNRGKTYRASHRVLPWHIISGSVELLLFYGGFKCSPAAVISCLIHSYTSLVLVKDLHNGYPPHTRPAYQAGSIMRSIQVVHAYSTQDPIHYHDCLMLLHGFVYTRVLIFLLGTMGPTRSFIKNVNSPFIYAQSALGAALISVGHCHGSWPMLSYLILMHSLGKNKLMGPLNTYKLTKHVGAHRKNDLPEPPLTKFLRYAGFVTCVSPADPSKTRSIGYLKADFLGTKWALV
ncbi:hypothetical protein BDV24DRAFT_156234 [Aspergillus arachidicola]|uniref:Uncharacterized protein n=1 Tax=Aspergillus arachidicola TaxID=656916 RepID=A0A5N6XS43_9EURO|nr:hypothetical protein BDV24DRAFT_156234 [Aspergillus arachidicola]